MIGMINLSYEIDEQENLLFKLKAETDKRIKVNNFGDTDLIAATAGR